MSNLEKLIEKYNKEIDRLYKLLEDPKLKEFREQINTRLDVLEDVVDDLYKEL